MSVELLTKIARAMQRGTIPADNLSTYSGSVEVKLFTHGESPKVLAWYEKTFPGGKHSVECRGFARTRPYPGKPRWFDRWRYVVTAGKGTLFVFYSLPHECVSFKATTDETTLTGDSTKDTPIWRCRHCDKPMTVTEARRRGLLPPLKRGAS